MTSHDVGHVTLEETIADL